MKITSQHILFFILLYPLFYVIPFIAFNVGYIFSLFYFIPFTLFIAFINIRKVKAIFLKSEIVNLALLSILIAIILLNTNSLRYSKPILFFFFILSFYFLSITLKFVINKKFIHGFVFFFILFSVLFLPGSERYMAGRYMGFLSSPTVYSVYLEVFLILAIFFMEKKHLKLILFIVSGIFILLTKTRLNIFFYFSIPLIIYYLERWRPDKLKLILVFVIGLNLVYPAYQYLMKMEVADELLASRYKDKKDTSFGLRIYMYNALSAEYAESPLSQKIFGKGTEASRKILDRKLGMDLPPHNDFVRFTVDFGLIATLLYLVILFRIARSNNLSFVLLLLYLFSFYHNMIYDFLLVALIIYFSALNKMEDQNPLPLLNPDKLSDV